MTKKLPKNSDYSPGENYSNTPVPGECVYTGMQYPDFGQFDEEGLLTIDEVYTNMKSGVIHSRTLPKFDSIQVNYIYKDKTLEVLERDFALKYPGPYKTFIEEQNRRLLDFMEIYTKNHEENR